jgi:hypothetical protein
MVLVMARLEAGRRNGGQRYSGQEQENNSRKTRGLTKNRYSDSPKKGQPMLSHGKMKKGDDVADDDDDDAVRTSVSQDQVTATMCTEELLLRPQYIQLSPHISDGGWGGGGNGWSTQHI